MMTTPVRQLRRRLGTIAGALALALLAALVVGTLSQPRVVAGIAGEANRAQQRFGPTAALAGIYLEETGVPMPVPSEVSIGYLGGRLRGNPEALVGSWIGLTALIVLGSTNLFVVSRRWGPRILHGPVGGALHLAPERVARARRWFLRWGPLAIGMARFVPGLRWAMVVTCGSLGVGYRTFWLGTAASAAIWAGALVTLGVTVGAATARALGAHPWIVLLLPLPAIVVITSGLVRVALQGRAVASAVAAPATPVTFGRSAVLSK